MIAGYDTAVTAAALRDFFIARDAVEMKTACERLAGASRSPSPHTENWQAVEFAFNRLFVGPKSLLAPPYASVYLGRQPFVMGETTLLVRRMYQMLGLSSPREGHIPEDHLALELDACLCMRKGLLHCDSAPLRAAYRFFLEKHMARWIPAFLGNVNNTPGLPGVIGWIGRELGGWLAREREWVCRPTRQN